MSNALRKLERNKNKNIPIYTEEQFNNKVKQMEENIKAQYKDKLQRIADEYLKQLIEKGNENKKSLSVEFFDVLACQMGYYEEDCEYKDEIRNKVIEIHNSVIDNLNKYKKYKHPEKEVKKKQAMIEKEFNVKF